MQHSISKPFLLFFLFLLSVETIPLQAIAPNAPREAGLLCAMIAPLEGPIVWDLCRYFFEGKKDWRNIKEPKAYLVSAALGVIAGGLVYFIGNKYTPQNKYAWSLAIKKEVDEDLIFMRRDQSNKQKRDFILEKIGSFMGAVDKLYRCYYRLKSAHACLVQAPEDVLEDLSFNKKCEILIKNIEELMAAIKTDVWCIIHTKQWFKELGCHDVEAFNVLGFYPGGVLLPEKYLFSFEWSIELIGGKVKRGWFFSPTHIMLPKLFVSRLVDWSIEYNKDKQDEIYRFISNYNARPSRLAK